MTDMHKHAQSKMNALEAWMAPLFAKTPHLPKGGLEFLANVVPWLALIFGILGILGAFSALSLFSVLPHSTMMPYAMPYYSDFYPVMIAGVIAGGIAAVLQVMAFNPLRARRKKGWSLLFYALTISAIMSVIQLLLGYSYIGGILGALIGYWLLFEIRALYR